MKNAANKFLNRIPWEGKIGTETYLYKDSFDNTLQRIIEEQMQKHRFKDVLHIKVIIQSNHGRAINVAATPEDLSLETWEEKAEPLLKQEAER